jgi:hypothetical protein
VEKIFQGLKDLLQSHPEFEYEGPVMSFDALDSPPA